MKRKNELIRVKLHFRKKNGSYSESTRTSWIKLKEKKKKTLRNVTQKQFSSLMIVLIKLTRKSIANISRFNI